MRGEDVDLLAEGTLPAAWSRRWADQPDAPVVHSPATGWVTASALGDRVLGSLGALQGVGLAAGDRVLISAAASVDLIAVHVAALATGLVVVPANTAYTAAELEHVATDSGARLAVLDREDRAPRSLPVMPVTSAAAAGTLDHQPQPGDPAMICYTSGTTGRPKGAVLTHANMLATAATVTLAWRWTRDDRLVHALPLFHMHGLGVGVHGTLLAGASMVLLPRFDPDLVLDAARDHEATMFFGVPTMYARLADSPRCAELSRLRLCVSGSAPLPAELHRRIAAVSGQHVLERYGTTETGINISNPYDGERRPGTVGFALPGIEVCLAPESHEILVRGPSVLSGYWHLPDDRRDGWFPTGDIGDIDADGYISIVGRLKELIITGGFNVYPREVEETLLRYPGVLEAAVAGTPDPEWGEVVTAYLVTDRPVAERELSDHCAATLAPYKRPRLVHIVPSLPRNALGKVDRAKLAPQ
jgi:malonyl-CoA/methylmalonyl-CoA synthetase